MYRNAIDPHLRRIFQFLPFHLRGMVKSLASTMQDFGARTCGMRWTWWAPRGSQKNVVVFCFFPLMGPEIPINRYKSQLLLGGIITTHYIYIIKQQKIIASNNFCPRHLLINIRLSIDPGNWQRVFQAPTHGSCWGIVIPLWQVHIAMKHCPLLDMTRMMVYLLNMVPIATLPEGITTY